MSTKTMEGKTKLKDVLDALKNFWSNGDEQSVTYTMSVTEATEIINLDSNAEVLNQVIEEVESMGKETQEPINKTEKNKKVMSQAGLNDLRNRLTGQTKKNENTTLENTTKEEKEIVD